jgi:lysozyme
MTTPFLAGDVARDEGLRLRAYPDPISPRAIELAKPEAKRLKGWQFFSGAPWTIGYGHCGPGVTEGLIWTLEQARATLSVDLAHACALLDANLPWWRTLSDVRQDVLANMCFNMGWGGLSGFVNTLAKIKAGDYAGAAKAMLASKWAAQVGDRAERLAEQMKTGLRA